MSRLIEADELKKQIVGMTIINNYSSNKTNALCDLIDAQPTAYDVDKIVAQLEEYREEMEQFKCGGMLSDMIEVVKAGGIDG